MTTLTKLALTQINTRLALENDALRAQVSQLQADFMRVTSVASAVNSMHQSRERTVQLERRAAMDAARAMALVSRKTVLA